MINSRSGRFPNAALPISTRFFFTWLQVPSDSSGSPTLPLFPDSINWDKISTRQIPTWCKAPFTMLQTLLNGPILCPFSPELTPNSTRVVAFEGCGSVAESRRQIEAFDTGEDWRWLLGFGAWKPCSLRCVPFFKAPSLPFLLRLGLLRKCHPLYFIQQDLWQHSSIWPLQRTYFFGGISLTVSWSETLVIVNSDEWMYSGYFIQQHVLIIIIHLHLPL